MNIRKLFLIALAVVMTVALAACQSAPAATSTTAPAAATSAPSDPAAFTTLKEGTLMVGMRSDILPWSIWIPTHNPGGL
jgi:hypothetical protein